MVLPWHVSWHYTIGPRWANHFIPVQTLSLVSPGTTWTNFSSHHIFFENINLSSYRIKSRQGKDMLSLLPRVHNDFASNLVSILDFNMIIKLLVEALLGNHKEMRNNRQVSSIFCNGHAFKIFPQCMLFLQAMKTRFW